MPYTKYKLQEAFTIGRGADNELILAGERTVSRRHATLRKREGQWHIENHSPNGLYVNGALVERTQKLSYGDILHIPETEFLFLGEYIASKECWSGRAVSVLKTEEMPEREKAAKTGAYGGALFHRAPRVMEEMPEICVEIEEPPTFTPEERDSTAMILGSALQMMLPMLVMNLFVIFGMRAEQEKVSLYVYSGLIMTVVSGITAVIWSFLVERSNARRQRQRERADREAYQSYLAHQDAVIRENYERQRKILNSRYVKAESLLAEFASCAQIRTLWNRNHAHEDFLSYRMGMGEEEARIQIVLPRENMRLVASGLWEEVCSVRRQYGLLRQVPQTLDLARYRQVGIVGTRREIEEPLRNLIAQIAWSSCYTEVRMGFVYGEDTFLKESLDFCRWLPHVWDDAHAFRFIAGSAEEARELFYRLLQIFREREERGQTSPHYILFLCGTEFLEGEMFSKYIFEEGAGGLSVVWITKKPEELPNGCQLILENHEIFSGWYETERQTGNRKKVQYDRLNARLTEQFTRELSRVKVARMQGVQRIAEQVDFLALYEVETVEELAIPKRWRENRIDKSARVRIGKKAGGASCYLDIHERYHGPHGLLAGTTGSGKSEVLQTFILSLAVNFSPEQINFLLIDYKGEGMAGLFSALPHVCGKLSNLSEGQADRAMLAIRSENRRRQRLFRANGVNHINDYMRLFYEGKASEALPHLLIIIDEFAELKKEKPEFMEKLISVAQVGRSLGVHLILATQKPGGIVDDKIWSNSRFRICLKVQEKQDSIEMLHKVDACQITQVGRGYLQVGNDEVYELFQAGYSGAAFRSEKKREGARLVARNGLLFGGDFEESACERRTQLDVVKEAIIAEAKRGDYARTRSLWMAPLAKKLYVKELEESFLEISQKASGERKNLTAQIGRFDDPEEQTQPVFSLPLLESGPVAVCGGSVSGKSVFLQTMLYTLLLENTAEELHIYLLDFGGSLANFCEELPQVGARVGGEDAEKMRRLFQYIDNCIAERKQRYQGGSYAQYRKAYGVREPLILLIIDDFSVFYEQTKASFMETVQTLLKDGEKLGILLIVTVGSFSQPCLSGRIGEGFKTRVCLYLSERYSYVEALGILQLPIYPEKGIPGRGVAYCGEKILEFQTALALEAANDYERGQRIGEVLRERTRSWTGVCARRLRVIPEPLDGKLFLEAVRDGKKEGEKIEGSLWLGYRESTAALFFVQLSEVYCFLVAGSSQQRIDNVLRMLLLVWLDTLPHSAHSEGACVQGSLEGDILPRSTSPDGYSEIYLVDFKRKFSFVTHERVHFLTNAQELFLFFEKLTPVFAARGDGNTYLVMIADLEEFMQAVYEDVYEMAGFVENVWEKGSDCGIYFFAGLHRNKKYKMETYAAFSHFLTYRRGIQTDGSLSDGPFFSWDTLPDGMSSEKLGKREVCYVEGENCPEKLILPEVDKDDLCGCLCGSLAKKL